MSLIAEDLLLLLLDDVKGKASVWGHTNEVLGGAVLAELALEGLVVLEEKKSIWRAAKVRVAGTAPADLDPILAEALATIAEKDRQPSTLVGRIGKGLDTSLAARLADRGILERRDDKLLGLFPRTRWPAINTLRKSEIHRAITRCLVEGAQPDPRTGEIIALLAAIGQAHTAITPGTSTSLTKRQLTKRAREIAKDHWAAAAVKDAVAAEASAGG